MITVAAIAALRHDGAAQRKAGLYLSTAAACVLLASCGGGSGGDAGSASTVQIPVTTTSSESAEPVSISVSSEATAKVAATSTATTTAAATSTATPTPTPSPAVGNKDRAPSGSLTQYAAQVGHCINMGNHLEAPNEGDWGRKLRDSDFPDIAKVGFDTVRLPVKFSAHADMSPPYALDPVFMARVDQVISQAIDAKLRVILDFHGYDELMADPDTHTARYVAIWKQVAARYRKRGTKLWFELLNEPKNKITASNISTIQDAALAAVRETNPTRPVLYTTASGGTIWGLYTLKTPADPNIIVTVHDYTPSNYTHQSMKGYATAAISGMTFGSADDIWTINDHANVVKSYMAKTGRPVILGEYGVNESVPVEERAKYYSTVSKAFEKAKVGTCAWAYTATFGFRNKTTDQWETALLKSIGL